MLGGAALDERRDAAAIARDDVHPLERRRDRPERRDVGPALRAGAEDDEAPGAGRGEVAHGEGRDRGRPQVRQRDAVDERAGRERLGVEEHVDALDPRQPAVGFAGATVTSLTPIAPGEDDGMINTSPASPATAWRAGSASGSRPPRSAASSASTASTAETRATRRRRGRGSRPGAHRSTKPVPTGSRGSSTKRCSPVR